MPNRYQRPPSSQRLSHFKARRPARNATTAPNRLENATEARSVVPCVSREWISRIASRTTTGGVKTTANAKLKASARDLATLSSIAVEMVAPEREKPRNGRHNPCTAPIRAACFRPKSFVGVEVPFVAVGVGGALARSE